MHLATRKIQAMLPTLLFLGLVLYYVSKKINGDRGLRAIAQRQAQLRAAQGELARIEAERDGWARRVSALNAVHLDPDALDERARAMLNLANPNDVVVPYAKGSRLF